MKAKALLAVAAFAAVSACGMKASAQEAPANDFECKPYYFTENKQNWFIQLGAGANTLFGENYDAKGQDAKHHMTAVYNLAFGKWFSPYLGWRAGFIGGVMHWQSQTDYCRSMNWVGANVDLMWDMLNTCGGVHNRVFSVLPFVGLGGAFSWDYSKDASWIQGVGGIKKNSFTLPVSAGVQLRLRLCKYVDFFAEGRFQFFGDNFNNEAIADPIDTSAAVLGGFNFNLGGRSFKSFNPCEYTDYINNLNNQVNNLRADLATTAAALAAAEAQLPCPEVQEQVTNVVEAAAPLMATVRFYINSARISREEMVNVYNTAQYLKENPELNITICGYADKNTGTKAYNMALSKRRAEAVRDALVKKYGIDAARLSVAAEGSNTQPYDVNNWNRIVIFKNN